MKKNIGYLRSFLPLSALLLFGHLAPGQSFADSLAQDDREIISSIAPYPADVRSAILDVAQYPQVLVKLERIQARSSQSFQDLISGYPREEQEKFYELSRFPDLMDQMARGGNRNQEEVKAGLKNLPAETQNRLMDVYNAHYRALVKMNETYQASQGTLQKIISDYPQNVQSDFQKVISMPDVMSLLTDNIDLTVSLGEDYKANPGEVTQRLEELNSKISSQNEKDLDDYKQKVASDPKLQSEMKSAATDFSSSYDHPDNPVYVTNNYYDNYPYPYWFSYPYWYSTPIWYPRPFYYHTGFYYGLGGALVVVGFPSMYYSNWFFGMGYYRHYPNLYHHYNNYYSAHRSGYGNVYRGFNNGAHSHFDNVGRNRPVTTGRGRSTRNYNNQGNTNRSQGNANSNGNRSTQKRGMNNINHRDARVNQMNVRPNNFNNRGLNQYQATQFHNSGWQHVGGGTRGGASWGGSSRGGSMGSGIRGGSSSGGSRGVSGGGGGSRGGGGGGGSRGGGGGGGRRGR